MEFPRCPIKQNGLTPRRSSKDTTKTCSQTKPTANNRQQQSSHTVPGGSSRPEVASMKPRGTTAEVLARMRIREKTVLGQLSSEQTTTRNEMNGERGDSRRISARETDLILIEEDQKNETEQDGDDSTRVSNEDSSEKKEAHTRYPIIHHKSGRTVRTRKSGISTVKSAWDTPRGDPPESSLKPIGAPSFSRSSLNRMSCVPLDDFDLEFDFDEGEAEMEAQREAKRRSQTTEAVYQKACEKLDKTPLAPFLRQCNIPSMDLRDIRLTSDEVKPIAIALVRDLKMQTLDLSNNELGPIGVCYIAEMLQENTTLFDLNLSATNPGREGVKALSETLRHNKSLGLLRLEENGIEDSESHLIADIIKNVPTLQGLYLGYNRLGYSGAAAIAAAVAQNKTMLTLDLQWNHIRRDSAGAIINALEGNTCLRQLNLAWNGLGKEGCLALAYVLPKNTSLRELDLTCNRVDILSLGFLLKGLVKNTQLTSLKIGQNPMTTQGAKNLIQAITAAPDMAISELDISGIPVDEEFDQLVIEAKKTRFLFVTHDEANNLPTEDMTRENDGSDLVRYDPVMVLFEYMKLDNLRVIDMFQYMDVKKRDKLSKGNIRDGLVSMRIPLTEHAVDVLVQRLDLNKDGFVELDEMMKVQRDMARHVKQRQIKARAKKKEDESINILHKILREVIAKRTEENESRRESLSLNRRRSSVMGQMARGSVDGRKSFKQIVQSRFSIGNVQGKKTSSVPQNRFSVDSLSLNRRRDSETPAWPSVGKLTGSSQQHSPRKSIRDLGLKLTQLSQQQSPRKSIGNLGVNPTESSQQQARNSIDSVKVPKPEAGMMQVRSKRRRDSDTLQQQQLESIPDE